MENQSQQAAPVGLEAIVEQLFAGKVEEFTPTNKDGTKRKTITFKPAKVKEVAAITRFFGKLIASLPRDKVEQLVTIVLEVQSKSINEQGQINLNKGLLLEKALRNNGLVLEIFAGGMDIVGSLIGILTDTTEDEFNALELEDAAIVSVGIFAVNYDFFTQTLPLILRSAVAGLNLKRQGSKNSNKKLPPPIPVSQLKAASEQSNNEKTTNNED